MSQWVTYLEAAKMVGCSAATIQNAIRDGHLTTRHAGRRYPSLDPSKVDRFAREFNERKDRAAEVWQRIADNTEPPDTAHTRRGRGRDRHLWNRACQLVRADRLPNTRRGRRIWIRLDHAQQAALARAFWAASDTK